MPKIPKTAPLPYFSEKIYDRDPAGDLVGWTSDANNLSVRAAAGHRRWVLNPFAVNFTYGQVNGFAAQKVFGYVHDPPPPPLIEVDFVAFPYEVYPAPLLKGDPPWSFSVIRDTEDFWGNQRDYFLNAEITVTRAADGEQLSIADRYSDSFASGIPNFLSWQVEGWDYDTLYEVEITGVTGQPQDYSYHVFIEQDGLE